MGRGRSYSDEFKRGAVRHLLESGKGLDAVARELNVAPASLFRWREQFREEVTSTTASATGSLTDNERAELEKLRKQVRVLEEERVILKKAAAFFAKESEK